MRKASSLALLLVLGSPLFAPRSFAQQAGTPDPKTAAFEQQELPGLVTLYKDLHAHPELSHYEEHISAMVAAELRKAGYTVADHLGVYADGTRAFGVVGVLKNGRGRRCWCGAIWMRCRLSRRRG